MSNRSMRQLREFSSGNYKTVTDVVANLSQIMGKFERVGGPTRTYTLDNGQKAAVYSVGGGVEGIGLAWHESPNNVRTIYYWPLLNVNQEPTYAVDIPAGEFEKMAPTVVDMIRKQSIGQVEVN